MNSLLTLACVSLITFPLSSICFPQQDVGKQEKPEEESASPSFDRMKKWLIAGFAQIEEGKDACLAECDVCMKEIRSLKEQYQEKDTSHEKGHAKWNQVKLLNKVEELFLFKRSDVQEAFLEMLIRFLEYENSGNLTSADRQLLSILATQKRGLLLRGLDKKKHEYRKVANLLMNF